MGKTRRGAAARRTDSRRRHVLARIAAAICALGGTAAIIVGAIAWTMDRPASRQLLPRQSVTVGRSPWFDSGTTIFVTPARGREMPGPDDLGCTLFGPDKATPLQLRADPDVVGTRVVADLSLTPLITVGSTTSEDRITCVGPAMSSAVVWLLPTSAGPSRTPLSVVIAGVALIGLAALLDPRPQGLRRGLG